MDVTLVSYLVYLLVSVALCVWVGRTLHRNGRAFLVDVFARGELADSVNHLLVVGFYLVNFGYVALALKVVAAPTNWTQSVESISHKVGLVLVVLGAMHFFNLFVFSRIRRHRQVATAPCPVPPDATLPLPAGRSME